jgi:hypothetical protein
MAHYSIAFVVGMSGYRALADTRRAPREHSLSATSVTLPE